MPKRLNAYDRALIIIKDELLAMSRLVGIRLNEAMCSFIEQDWERAQTIVAGDDEIDLFDESIEQKALELIPLQQPTDYELRFLTAAMRIGRELERIGDYACDIADATLQLSRGPFFKPLVDLPRLGELVQMMMSKSLRAYFEKDLSTARQLDDDDGEVDSLFIALLEELTGFMKRDPEYVDQASMILLVARYLERIGDHVVNIAEMCIFVETGERHPFKVRKSLATNISREMEERIRSKAEG